MKVTSRSLSGGWKIRIGSSFVYFMRCNTNFPVSLRASIDGVNARGAERLEQLLQVTIQVAVKAGMRKPAQATRVNVDTTVQEKAIAFPTAARLYHKMCVVLVRQAQRRVIPLRQSYRFVGKRALFKQGRYTHVQQMKQAARMTGKLKTYLGRAMRDIERKTGKYGDPLNQQLQLTHRLLARRAIPTLYLPIGTGLKRVIQQECTNTSVTADIRYKDLETNLDSIST